MFNKYYWALANYWFVKISYNIKSKSLGSFNRLIKYWNLKLIEYIKDSLIRGRWKRYNNIKLDIVIRIIRVRF